MKVAMLLCMLYSIGFFTAADPACAEPLHSFITKSYIYLEHKSASLFNPKQR
jgi:hypothetical protein